MRVAGAVLAALFGSVGCVLPSDWDGPPTDAFESTERTRLGRELAHELAQHPDRSGLVVLERGVDAFAARIALIAAAEAAVDLQVYILHDDETGRMLMGRLVEAADRGVRVRLLVDDLGTKGIDTVLAALDAHPRIEVRLFNAFARGSGAARALDLLGRPKRLNRRMHNKLMTADGAGAIVGGRNVGDEYFDAREDVNFADLDLLVFGPVLPELGESFDLYWNSEFVAPIHGWSSLRVGARELDDLRRELSENDHALTDSPYAERVRAGDFVQALTSGELPVLWAPVHGVADLPHKIAARGKEIEETLLTTRLGESFHTPEKELLIVSPYFVPGAVGVAKLGGLVADGVRVAIVTNSLQATDVPIVHAGYSRYRRALLAAGVELYELRPSGAHVEEAHSRGLFGSEAASLHAKTFLVDRDMVYVGSMNLDPRSIVQNTEIGLVVSSTELADELARNFARLAGPEASWKVELEGTQATGSLSWSGSVGGVEVRLEAEPGNGFWKSLLLAFLGALPIEGQI